MAAGTSAPVGAVVGMASVTVVVSGSTAGSAATGTVTDSVAARTGSGPVTDKVGSGPFEAEKVSGSTESTFPCSTSAKGCASASITGGMGVKIASDLIWGPAGGVEEGSVTTTVGPASMMGMGELTSVAGGEDETVLFSAAFTGTIVMRTLGARGDTGISGSTAEGGTELGASSAVTGADS